MKLAKLLLDLKNVKERLDGPTSCSWDITENDICKLLVVKVPSIPNLVQRIVMAMFACDAYYCYSPSSITINHLPYCTEITLYFDKEYKS